MLAASQPAPKPANWQGVREGLALADRLMHAQAPDQACDALREVLEFAPMEARAWHMLGKALQHMGEHEEALGCFSTAEALYGKAQPRSETPIASVRLAGLLWDQGEHAAARAMLGILLLKQPDDPRLQQLREEWEEQPA